MFLKIKCCPFSAKLALFIALLIKTVDIKSSTAASKIGLSDNQFEIEDNKCQRLLTVWQRVVLVF